MKLIYVDTSNTNPYMNLAMEEYLLDVAERSQCLVVYFWQNQDTIVIGRNQNAYTECDVKKAQQEKVFIARRKTGGGAVFHDMGNLNFTFIYSKAVYEQQQSLNIVKNALCKLDFNAKLVGRNDLVINGYKISGSAFYSNDRVCMHHGTIMVAVDFDKLSSLLNVSKNKLSAHNVSSVRSRVANLREFNKHITIGRVKEGLYDSFRHFFAGEINDIVDKFDFDDVVLKKLYLQYASSNWNMAEFQTYTVFKTERFAWGEVSVYADVEGKKVNKVRLASDSLFPDKILAIEQILNNLNENDHGIADVISCNKDIGLFLKDVLFVYESLLEEIV